VHTVFAPPYGTILLSADQLTGGIAGFEHFTDTNSNYIFHYYSIPEQPYADFHLGRQQIIISYNCMCKILNMV
jgi:hypothetical protein